MSGTCPHDLMQCDCRSAKDCCGSPELWMSLDDLPKPTFKDPSIHRESHLQSCVTCGKPAGYAPSGAEGNWFCESCILNTTRRIKPTGTPIGNIADLEKRIIALGKRLDVVEAAIKRHDDYANGRLADIDRIDVTLDDDYEARIQLVERVEALEDSIDALLDPRSRYAVNDVQNGTRVSIDAGVEDGAQGGTGGNSEPHPLGDAVACPRCQSPQHYLGVFVCGTRWVKGLEFWGRSESCRIIAELRAENERMKPALARIQTALDQEEWADGLEAEVSAAMQEYREAQQ